MLKQILTKIANREPLTELERLSLSDWAERAENVGATVNPFTGQTYSQPQQSDINLMVEQAVTSSARQYFPRLSDITNQMGLQIAGEFRTGTGVPGDGFTGGRFGYPGFTYGSTSYFLAGVANDVLQVGLSLTDGKIYAGAGDITMDINGISLSNNASKLIFKDTTGAAKGYVFMNSSNEMGILNEKNGSKSLVQARNAAGQANKLYIGEDVEFYVTLTNGTSGALEWREDPGNVNAYQLAIPNATNGTNLALAGSEVIIWGGKDGKTTVFNAGNFDIDFRVHGDTVSDMIWVDAGNNQTLLGNGALTVFGTGGLTQITDLKVDAITNDTGLAHGTYTPTLTNTTNIAASTLNGTFSYIRVGNTVNVAGCVSVDPTAAGTTTLTISLPIASNFGGAFDCNGTASSQATNTTANMASSGTSDAAIMTFTAVDLSNQTFRVIFTYQVI
jgi:hypothetical protein